MIDPAVLAAIQREVRSDFAGAFKGQPTTYQDFTTEVPASEQKTWFEFVGALPRVRKWIGERQIKRASNYNYSVQSEPWEMTIQIDENELFQKSQTVLTAAAKQRVASLGAQYRKDYPSDTIIDLIEAGTTGLAYDSVAFFSNVSGVRTFDNLLAGTGTDITHILADISSARSAMRRFTDEEGRALNIVGSVALIPPELETVFMTITKARTITGTDNIGYGMLKYIVDARLSDVDDWYLFAVDEFIKPIISVQVGEIKVEAYDSTFHTRSVEVGASSRGNVGYSFPQLAVKIVN